MVPEDLPALPSAASQYALAVRRVRARPGPLPSRTLRVRDVPVQLDQLARYVRVCGFPLTDALPPTFVHVLAMPLHLAVLAAPDFPLVLPGLVHTANRITQHCPVRLDERPTLSGWASDLRPHEKGALVDVHTRAEVDGDAVWEGCSTYLARGFSTPKVPGGTSGQRLDDVPRDDRRLSASWRIPADAGRRYAAVSGDINPIHLSPVTSRAFGYARPIAHGMWLHARCLAHLGPRVPDAVDTVVRFRAPVVLPSRVAVYVSRSPIGHGAPGTTVEVRRPDQPPEPGDDRALTRTLVRAVGPDPAW